MYLPSYFLSNAHIFYSHSEGIADGRGQKLQVTEKDRRNPKQGRAKATVEAILEATFQVLETEGPAALTTNHIAARAGVSIGTLYQYFSDREDILAELGQREATRIRERIAEILTRAPERGTVRAIVQALMSLPRGTPATRVALSDALFARKGEGVLSAHHLTFLDSISGRTDFDFALGRESAFVLTHAAICLLRAAAAEPELALDMEVLEDELVLLMESYLAALSSRSQA